ncbi:MAG TPA: stage III sporulation protein AE, partial [Brevibacillus sp.]|nr:stage III sporulation protein AE [Brevibacillus sp.]
MTRYGWISACMLFLFLLYTPVQAVFATPAAPANPINELVQQQVSHLNTESVEQYWKKLQKEYQ